MHYRIWSDDFRRDADTLGLSLDYVAAVRVNANCPCGHTAFSIFYYFNNTRKCLGLFWDAARGCANRSDRHISPNVDLWTERNCSLFNAGGGGGSWEIQHHRVSIPKAFEFWHELHAMFAAHVCVVGDTTVSHLVVVMNFTCVCCLGGGWKHGVAPDEHVMPSSL